METPGLEATQANPSPSCCSVSLCETVVHAKGYCVKHYRRWLRRGRRDDRVVYGRPLILCGSPGCKNSHHAGGWCKHHYDQRKKPSGTCSQSECRNGVQARGLCSKHYTQWRRHPSNHNNAEVAQG